MGIGIVMTCCLFGLSAVGCIEDNSTVNKTDDPNVSLFECRDGLEYDMCMYLENLTQVEGGWEDDGAFIPTITTFAFTFCVGITGNLLVLFALLGDRKARNVTSSFLVSLAIADLVFLCICVPYEVGIKMRKEWVAGEAVCKLFGFIEMLSAAASVLNLTAVSVERVRDQS
ncbi:hypothetical protein CAPTEDRAFT_201974 [Capitella teleta]|uniref:G-protein coupled receptors family 1 profile domain-containing protein n=1 Tax=Capitella teleta TaxID=283909 RepID=R7UTR9_CAPTE|nr:hypothetical protein CAPTEDRAFT_201974 [Capitella teleta]|eukprot:ELU09924.1 hypothetical protein CAPTEDRAFT_201974 [Capitella teleta]